MARECSSIRSCIIPVPQRDIEIEQPLLRHTTYITGLSFLSPDIIGFSLKGESRKASNLQSVLTSSYSSTLSSPYCGAARKVSQPDLPCQGDSAAAGEKHRMPTDALSFRVSTFGRRYEKSASTIHANKSFLPINTPFFKSFSTGTTSVSFATCTRVAD